MWIFVPNWPTSPYSSVSHPEEQTQRDQIKNSGRWNPFGLQSDVYRGMSYFYKLTLAPTCTFLGAEGALDSCLNFSLSCKEVGGPLGSAERITGREPSMDFTSAQHKKNQYPAQFLNS